MFTALEAFAARVFRDSDGNSGKTCLRAARRCRQANVPGRSTFKPAWRIRAFAALASVTGEEPHQSEAVPLARVLMALP